MHFYQSGKIEHLKITPKLSYFWYEGRANDSATSVDYEVTKEGEVSGKIYDAFDHEQLLWVHASIYFYEKTVSNSQKENIIKKICKYWC